MRNGIIRKQRLFFALLAALLLVFPAAYYGYFRLLRKEHFYRGLPTSFWAHRIRDFICPSDYTGLFPDFVYDSLQVCGFARGPLLLRGDAAAVPVLMDLLYERGAEVEEEAIFSLSCTPCFGSILADPNRCFYYESVTRSGEYLVVSFSFMNVMNESFSHTCVGDELVLIDREGNLVDAMSYSLSGNCRQLGELVAIPDPDKGEVVIRRMAEKSAPACSELRPKIEHHGQTFDWGTSRNWAERGPCRVAVRNGRFAILWPSPHESGP
jgi:hypothetical protein